jgi:cytidylate kinase
MTKPSIIAIDGPAASGKSTLGFRLAEALGFLFFDTGIMYRAVTWAAILHKIDVNDEHAITTLAEKVAIDIRPPSTEDGRACDVLIDRHDATWEIRKPEVEAFVSIVAAYPGVRKALSAQQRRIGLRGQVVMVGRDIGTVILPEADLKIYLDASPEVRAKRRYDENINRGKTADYDAILANVRERDQIDSTRAVAPLAAADDAIHLDSDALDAGQVFLKVKALCQ